MNFGDSVLFSREKETLHLIRTLMWNDITEFSSELTLKTNTTLSCFNSIGFINDIYWIDIN